MDGDSSAARAGQLDAVRALCVIAVVISHTISERARIGQYQFFDIGAYGVYMFFVLSGYLITSQLLVTRDRRAAFGDPLYRPLILFYAKRILRLFPAYYLALALAALVDIPGIRAEMKWHLLQLSDILFAVKPGVEDLSAAGHFWTLTVEWQFYLIWPLLALCLPRRLLGWTAAAMIAAGCYAWSPLNALPAVVDRSNIVESLDSLGFGVALAILQHRGWDMRRPVRWGWPAAAISFVGIGLDMAGQDVLAKQVEVITHEAMNLAFAAITIIAARGIGGVTGRMLDNHILQYLGRISYGIYVYHQFLLYWYMDPRYGRPEPDWGLGLSAMLFAASTVAAMISWHGMEAPLQRLRRHLAYRRRPRRAIDEGILPA